MVSDDGGFGLGVGGISAGTRVGSGASADVYRAEQPALGRTVAVKIITAPSIDSALVRRFSQENRALGALSSHPNIVTVYDAGISQHGRPYVVMQFVEGGSLAGARLPVDQVVEIGIAIAGALAEAHEHPRRILHRDVKPANILMDPYGNPLLADFGLAVLDEVHRATTLASIGTPAFMAPELFYDAEPSVLTDVYGFAATLYALVTGHPPFSHDDPPVPTVIRRATTEPLEFVPSGPLGAFIGQGMAVDPTDRPQSMLDCAQALQAIQRQSQAAVTPMYRRDVGALGAGAPSDESDETPPVSAETGESHLVAAGSRGSRKRGLLGWLVLASVLTGLLGGFLISTSTSDRSAGSELASGSGANAAAVTETSTTVTSTIDMPVSLGSPGAADRVEGSAEPIGARLSPTSVPLGVESEGCVATPLLPALVPTGAVTVLVDGCPYWRSTLSVSSEMHEYSLDLGLGQMITISTDSVFTAIMTPSGVPLHVVGPEGGSRTFVAAETGRYRVRIGGAAAIEPAGPQTVAFFTR